MNVMQDIYHKKATYPKDFSLSILDWALILISSHSLFKAKMPNKDNPITTAITREQISRNILALFFAILNKNLILFTANSYLSINSHP